MTGDEDFFGASTAGIPSSPALFPVTTGLFFPGDSPLLTLGECAEESGFAGFSSVTGVLGVCFSPTLIALSGRSRGDADDFSVGASNDASLADEALGDGDDGTD